MFRSWWLPVLLIFSADFTYPGDSPPLPPLPPADPIFRYGVASGDPLEDALIIWTMLDSAVVLPDSSCYWEVAPAPAVRARKTEPTQTFPAPILTGRVLPDSAHHYRVKVDVTGLDPGTDYYYRFRYGDRHSPVGRGRTAPSSADEVSVQLGVVSCNAYEYGYFNAFEALADRDDIDAVVHLGDYIYEYATGVYGDTTLGRIHAPRHEALTAEDYHRRYAQYRSDPQLQLAHARHPFICVWDDHEFANNSHREGAENHDPATEGDFLTRRSAARQLYYDWMPVRENPDGQLYRSFRFGRNVELHMLDERLAGRTAPASDFNPISLADTNREMLGAAQFDWLSDQLRKSDTRWQLIGNQVLFAGLDLSDILPQYAVNLDAWDGYRHAKQRLTDTLARYQPAGNTVFLTGDTHCAWHFELADASGQALGYEFATPSVSSANYDEFVASWDTLAVARYRLYRDNAHLRYTNITDHGYLTVRVDFWGVTGTFHFLETIRQRNPRGRSTKTYHLPYVEYPAYGTSSDGLSAQKSQVPPSRLDISARPRSKTGL